MKNSNHSFLFLLLATFFIASCSTETSKQSTSQDNAVPAKQVRTASVQPVEENETIFATGKLASKLEAKLSFKTGGIIKEIYVSEGQKVRKGQTLALLDLDEIQAQVQQAQLGQQQSEINVENAKLALQLAERDYKNATGLYQDSVATLEQLENAEVQLNNAKNQLKAAKTGLAFSEQTQEVADFNLRYSKIIAPSSGIILKKVAEVNELVGPGTPVLLFGSSEKAQVIRVNITDKDIIYVRLGDKAAVAFDAYPGESFEGVVREIASMADPYTNTFEVEIEVDAKGKRLLSGFIGTVNITTTGKTSLLEVPVDALLSANERSGSIFVVENGKAARREVRILRIRGDKLLVDKGVVAGEEVIVSGVGYLEDDEPVLIGAK
jgi:RND family efflux transporter MFP subunit